MRNWTRIAGAVFSASLAVYSGSVNPVLAALTAAKDSGASNNDVKLVDDASSPAGASAASNVDPFAVTAPASPANTSNNTTDGPTTNPSVVPLGDSPAGGAGNAPTGQGGTSISASQVNVSDAGTVEIHVNDANLLEVLRMLSLQSQRNIVASKEVTGTITANLYNVTVREALDAILHANGYAYREKGNFIYVYTTKELLDMDKASRQLTTQVFHLYYTPAANAVNMIKPVLSEAAQVAFTTPPVAGIDSSGTKDTGGNSHAGDDTIVVTDYADNLDKVKKIIKDIDRRPQQVLVEATILSASLTDDNALGVNLSFLGGVDFTTLFGSGNGTSSVLSPGIINNPSSGSGGGGSTGTSTGAGPIIDKGFAGFQTGGGGLQVGVVHQNLSVFVNALESVSNTTVLANPKVLALDKQKGEVNVGAKLGYLTSTTSATTTTQTVEFLQTGTRLIFRPFIGDDGYIRMEIHPEDSSGSLNAAGIPQEQTTEVTSNVMVKDGHTIVIGGLFRDASSITRGQVPGLGSIPFLGALFRQQADSTTREEVIILLTPHIIKDDSAYSAVSEADMKRADEYRAGVRTGMMFFSRERLAETAYQNAMAEMNKPVPDRAMAMWHLNNATGLNPTFIEAIEMKERLSGKHVTSVDNSSIRSFVSRAILADNGPVITAPPVNDITPRQPATENGPAEFPTSQPAGVMPVIDAAPTTEPSTQPAVVELPTTQPVTEADAATTQPSGSGPSTQPVAALPATQPTMPEDQGTNVTTVLDDAPKANEPDAFSNGDDLVHAAHALADAAGRMANAADDLAHFAESQPAHGKQSAMPTTQRSSKESTLTAVPLEDGGN